MSYQKWIAEGYLGSDCETRYTPGGKLVASFSLAINNGSGDKATTLWFRVTAWDKQAELIADLKKKAHVLVEGRIEQARSFTDKQGNQRVAMEATASQIRFLDKRGDGGPVSTEPQQGEEDIPF